MTTFGWAVRNAALAPTDEARDIQALALRIERLQEAYAFKSVVYSENHDKDDPQQQQGGRLPPLIGEGRSDGWIAKKLSTLVAAVVLTTAGVPMLFMGQEFLEYEPFPNYGGPPHNYGYPKAISWDRRDQFSGIVSLYRDLIRLRRNWYSNTRGLCGTGTHVLPVGPENMLVYGRWDRGGPEDGVMVVCNFANHSYTDYRIGFPRPGIWRVRFNSDANTYDGYFGGWSSFDATAEGPSLNGMPFSGSIGIAAYTCVMLSQEGSAV